MDKIDYEKGTIVLEGKEYDMILHASMLESRERGTKYDHETCTAKI